MRKSQQNKGFQSGPFCSFCSQLFLLLSHQPSENHRPISSISPSLLPPTHLPKSDQNVSFFVLTACQNLTLPTLFGIDTSKFRCSFLCVCCLFCCLFTLLLCGRRRCISSCFELGLCVVGSPAACRQRMGSLVP